MSQKYRVKEGCRLEHDNQKYIAGDLLELDPELALFHADNIEVVKTEPISEVHPVLKSQSV